MPELVEELRRARQERDALRARIEAPPRPFATDVELRERIHEKLDGLRCLLQAGPEDRRRVMRALLGNRRLRVAADPERGFRVEGLLRLSLDTRTAQDAQHASGRFIRMVAGGLMALKK